MNILTPRLHVHVQCICRNFPATETKVDDLLVYRWFRRSKRCDCPCHDVHNPHGSEALSWPGAIWPGSLASGKLRRSTSVRLHSLFRWNTQLHRYLHVTSTSFFTDNNNYCYYYCYNCCCNKSICKVWDNAIKCTTNIRGRGVSP